MRKLSWKEKDDIGKFIFGTILVLVALLVGFFLTNFNKCQ